MTPDSASSIIGTAMAGLQGEMTDIAPLALGVGVLVFAVAFGFRWAKGLIS